MKNNINIFLVRIGEMHKPGSRVIEVQARDSRKAEVKAWRLYPQYDDIRCIGRKA